MNRTPTDPPDDWDDDRDDDDDGGDSRATLSVGDPVTRKTRRLSRQCDTCIFRPGNLMHLTPGRLKDIVDEALAKETYIVCHETLPGMNADDVAAALCRGFHDRYTTSALQVMERLWGFIDVDPPTVA